MEIEYADPTTKREPIGSNESRTGPDHFREWKKRKADLLKRADEHIKRAGQLKRSNPALSAELMKRAKVLKDEAAAMSKPKKGDKGLSTEQIRRASVLGWLALLKDKN